MTRAADGWGGVTRAAAWGGSGSGGVPGRVDGVAGMFSGGLWKQSFTLFER